jgi:hypothetical protein
MSPTALSRLVQPQADAHLFTDVSSSVPASPGCGRAGDPPELDVLSSPRTRSRVNSTYAQGGIAGVLSPEDRFENHIEDTLTAGADCAIDPSSRWLSASAGAIRDLVHFAPTSTRRTASSP